MASKKAAKGTSKTKAAGKMKDLAPGARAKGVVGGAARRAVERPRISDPGAGRMSAG
jgi:hypothetical protein